MYSDNNIRISLTGQKKEEVPSKLEIFYSIFETKSRKKNLYKTLLLKKLLIKYSKLFKYRFFQTILAFELALLRI